MLKKKSKIISTIIVLIMLICLRFALGDYLKVKENKKPLFVIASKKRVDNQKIFYGIGYKVVECYLDNTFHIGFYNMKNRCPFNSIDDFIITDENEICASALEFIYEDENYKYYFPCLKSNTVFIEFADGQRVSVNQILNNPSLFPITIYEIIKKDPDLFYKEEK